MLPPSSALIVKTPIELENSGEYKVNPTLYYQYLDSHEKTIKDEYIHLTKTFSTILNNEPYPLDFSYDSENAYSSIDIKIPWLEKVKSRIHKKEKQIKKIVIKKFKNCIITIIWWGSDIDIRAISPSGKVYLGTQVTPTMEALSINNPEEGEWTIEVIGVDIPPEGENYTLTMGATDTEADIPELEFNKEFRKKFSGKFSGRVTVKENITLASDIPVSKLKIEDELLGKWKAYKNQMYLTLDNGTKSFIIPQSEYDASVADGKIHISLDFAKGVELKEKWFCTLKQPKHSKLKKYWEKRCSNDNKTIYLLEKDNVIKLRYSIHKKTKLQQNYTTETIVTATSLAGEITKMSYESELVFDEKPKKWKHK